MRGGGDYRLPPPSVCTDAELPASSPNHHTVSDVANMTFFVSLPLVSLWPSVMFINCVFRVVTGFHNSFLIVIQQKARFHGVAKFSKS